MADNSKRGLSASKSRSSGMKGPRASAGRAGPVAAKGKPGPRLPGEKSVRPTSQTVDMKPLRVSREAKKPMDPRAIDHRNQLYDDPIKNCAPSQEGAAGDSDES
jgi:hypothetical protein